MLGAYRKVFADVVFTLQIHAGNAQPSAALDLERRTRNNLRIAISGNDGHDLLVFDELLVVILPAAIIVENLSTTGITIFAGNIGKLITNIAPNPVGIRQHRRESINFHLVVLNFFCQLLDLERHKRPHAHLKDRLNLPIVKSETLNKAG